MPLENMKFDLDRLNAAIQSLPQSTREIMSNADELIRRSDILVKACNELYLQVKDVGAYVKRPVGIFSIATARDCSLYLSRIAACHVFCCNTWPTPEHSNVNLTAAERTVCLA